MSIRITSNTRIIELLGQDKDKVIGALVKLNRNFAKLKNPILRNLLARRVSIADACKIAGCTIDDFAEAVKDIGFTIDKGIYVDEPQSQPKVVFKQADRYRVLDVRPIIDQDKDPLKEILANISVLEANQGLKLINTFEPLPLIHLLADRGFAHFTVSPEPGLVITYFNQTGAKPTIEKEAVDYGKTVGAELFDEVLRGLIPEHINYLDVRQLEMPKPMLAILEQIKHLGVGEALFVYHKKIPVYLLPELEKQRFRYAFNDIGPGDINMLIFKP